MSARVGLVLVAGGVGLYAASETLPLKFQVPAKLAGIGLAGYGVFELLSSLTSKLGASGGVLGAVSEAIAGVPSGEREGERSIAAVAPRAINPEATGRKVHFEGRFLDPIAGGNARKAPLGASYPVIVEVANLSGDTFSGRARVTTEESYVFGANEHASSVSDEVTLRPGERATLPLDVPVGGGRIIYSTPYVVAKLHFADRVLDVVDYYI